MVPLLLLEDLTCAEKWIILRRRMGKTQKVMAQELEISFRKYRQLEIYCEEFDNSRLTEELKAGEACYLLRLRSGLTQEFIAQRLRVSRYILSLIERGDYDKIPLRVIDYWKRYKHG